MKTIWIAALALALGAALATAQSPTAEAAVRAARAASNQAIAGRDMPAYLATITDAFVITTGSGPSYTRAEFLKLWTANFADPNWLGCVRTPDHIQISESQPAAAEEGHFRCASKGEAYSGAYLAKWQNTGDGWKTQAELYVTLTSH